MHLTEFQHLPEFDGHEKVIRIEDPAVGLLGFIAIHRRLGDHPSLGATRFWEYDTETDALRDALRLSHLMSYKSALAGLPYGGAKCVLMRTKQSLAHREELFRSYAQHMNTLNGEFVTGSDVGVGNSDLEIMCSESPYVIGNHVNAGYYTALGVLVAIEEVMAETLGTKEIRGRRFAVQGLGKTGLALAQLLHERDAHLVISDIDVAAVESARRTIPSADLVGPSEIHSQEVDVLCPCALSHAINEGTIGELRCNGIAGAANNQLISEEVGKQLHALDIVYAPDYVANSGGLLSVVDQFRYGSHDDARIQQALLRIGMILKRIFSESRASGRAPNVIADEMAREIISKH